MLGHQHVLQTVTCICRTTTPSSRQVYCLSLLGSTRSARPSSRCVMPHVLWKSYHNLSASLVGRICETASKAQRTIGTSRTAETLRLLNNITYYFVNLLTHLRTRSLSRVIVPYLIYKFLCILSALFQLVFISNFMDVDKYWHGFEAPFLYMKWSSTKRFQRIVFCELLQFGSHSGLENCTYICTLTINVFIDFTFTFLWFWFLILEIYVILDFIVLVVRVITLAHTQSYITNQLHATQVPLKKQNSAEIPLRDDVLESQCTVDGSEVKKFIWSYLVRDGMLMVWIISSVGDDEVAAEVVCRLWKLYQEPATESKLCTGTAAGVNDYQDGPASANDYQDAPASANDYKRGPVDSFHGSLENIQISRQRQSLAYCT